MKESNIKSLTNFAVTTGISTYAIFMYIFLFLAPSPALAHAEKYQPNHAHVCTASTSLNVRSGPNTSTSIKGSVTKGSKVTVKATYSNWETNDVWYEIYLSNGSTGYISGDYVCF